MNCYDFYIKYLKLITLDKPDVKQWSFWKIQRYYLRRAFLFVCIAYSVVFSALDIFFREQIIMTEIAINVIDITVYGNSIFRILYAIHHNDNVHTIINQMNSFKSSTDPNFETRNMSMAEAIVNTKRFMILWIFFAFGCIGLCHASALMEIFSPDSTRIHVIEMYCFYDCTRHPYYEITLLFEMATQQMHGLAYINLDIFFFGTAILLSQQFDILCSDTKNIMYSALVDIGVPTEEVQTFKENVNSSKITNYIDLASQRILDKINSKKYSRALKNKMGACIRHHQALLKLLTRLQTIISLSSAFQCIFSTGYLMFSLFAIVVYDDNAVKMNAITYLYGATVQISCMCMIGQMLSNQFDKLRTAVTEIPWYLIHDKNFNLTNIIMLLNLDKPYKVAAGKFFELSHEMLIQIYRTAFTYFTVLMEVATTA